MKYSVVLTSLLVATAPAFTADAPKGQLTSTERLQTEHLKGTHEARLRFARERQTLPDLGVYEDFRAVLHVHAEDSNHTKGTRAEVLAAAKKARDVARHARWRAVLRRFGGWQRRHDPLS
jgi:hypothetical protein